MDLQKLMKNIQLMQCIKNNNINEAEELLNAGADANFVNLHGVSETPLHEAVLTGNSEMVQLLLARGADCEAKNAQNNTPIDLCSLLDDQKKQIIEAVFHECANTSVKIVPRSHEESDPTNGTFHKRSGTANVGQYYETKLLTMVLCRILHDGKIGSFFLGNNLEEVGAFDDIVLKTSIGGKSQVYFLQAKHKKKEHLVKFEELVSIDQKDSKGAFSLPKYFDSFLKIRYLFSPGNSHPIFQEEYEQTELKLIIFTPAKFDQNEAISYENTYNCNVFQTKTSGKNFKVQCTDALLEYLILKSTEWHKKAISDILVKLILLEEYSTTNLKESINRLQEENIFKKYMVQNELFNSVSILQLYNNQKVMETKSNNIKKLVADVSKILTDSLLPSLEDHTKLVTDFFNKLSLYSGQATEDELDGIIEGIIKSNKYENEDLIFLKSHDAIAKWWKQDGQVQFLTKKCQIFEDAANEVKLEKIHSNCLKKLRYDMVKFCMDSVDKCANYLRAVNENNCVNVFSSTPQLTCMKIVQHCTQNKNDFKFLIIESTDFSETLEVLSVCVPKCLVIAYVPKKDNIIIESIRTKVDKLVIITPEEYISNCKSIRDESRGLIELETESQKLILEKVVTFQDFPIPLRMLMDIKAARELIDSNTLQKLLIDEKFEIANSCLSWSQQDLADCYIDRILLDYHKKSVVYSLNEISDKVVVVAAEPGMGKSTLLEKLANDIKKSSPASWIVRINLLDYTNHLLPLSKISTLNEEHAMNLLKITFENGQQKKNKTDSLQNKLFEWYCQQSKIILLIDGFDEISPDYTDTVLQLLQFFKNCYTSKLWVTTRFGEAQNKLEKSLNAEAYSLEPFSAEEAKMLLRISWKKILEFQPDQLIIDSYVEKVLSHLFESIEKDQQDLLSVPLQIKMIAIIYQTSFKAFYNSKGKELVLEKLDLATIFEKFIDLKFKIFLNEEKNKIDASKPDNKLQLSERFKLFKDMHKQAAIISLFKISAVKKLLSKAEIEKNNVFLQDVHNSVEKTGIVKSVTNGKPIFVHQTYAEFFAALFLWEKYCSLQTEEFKNFIQSIFIRCLVRNNQVQIVKFILAIARKSIKDCPNFAVKASMLLEQLLDLLTESTWWFNKNNKTFSFMLEIVECSLASDSECFTTLKTMILGKPNEVGNLLLKATESGYIWTVRLVINEKFNLNSCWSEGLSALHIAARNNHPEIIRLLVKSGMNTDCVTKDGKGQTPLHEAVQFGSEAAVKALLSLNANINFGNSDDGSTPLHIAAGRNDPIIIELLIKGGGKVNNLRTADGRTPLYEAVCLKALDSVKMLLHFGANVHLSEFKIAYTPLHMAAQENCPEIIKLLLEHKADINCTTTDDGRTPLYEAVRFKAVDSVKVLFHLGSNAELGTSTEAYTPLHMAAQKNCPEIIEMLLEHKVDINCTTTDNGRTPLFEAVRFKAVESVEVLLQLGSNVELGTSTEAYTPLHMAAQKNCPKIIKLLLEHKADINCTTTDDGRTALYEAVRYKAVDSVKVLLDLGANALQGEQKIAYTPLHVAAQKNCPEVIKMLLEHKADINCTTTDDGRTPLYEAVSNKSVDSVKVLLDLGANALQGEQKIAYTPLHMAAQENCPDIIKLLLDHKADINCTTTDDGRTPLYEAVSYEAVESVKILLGLDANTQLGTSTVGYTPLHMAAQNNCPKIIKMLLEHKADINCTTTDDGRTPLFEAVRFKAVESVKMLLDLGANALQGEQKIAYTPLHMAAQINCPDIIEMLLKHKADINCTTTDDGRTPLFIAISNSSMNAVQVLLDAGACVQLKTK